MADFQNLDESSQPIQNHGEFCLGDINILIGANSSGKSNFLEVFKLVKNNLRGNLQRYVRDFGSPDSLFFNGPGETKVIEFYFEFGNNAYEFMLNITREEPPRIYLENETCYFLKTVGEKDWYPEPLIETNASPLFYESQLPIEKDKPGHRGKRSIAFYVYESINGWKIYHFHNTDKSSALRQSWEVNDSSGLHSNGENLAPFLMNLRERHPNNYRIFLDAVRMVFPFFGDFLFIPTEYGNGAKQVGLSWRHRNSEFIMQPYQLSDGAIRFIALLACLLQRNSPSTIVIDEPELGMHPYAIEVFADIIKAYVGSQIIMATQSPYLVSAFNPEDIIAVNNKGDGSIFKRMNSDELAPWLEEYTLGDLWYKNIIEASP